MLPPSITPHTVAYLDGRTELLRLRRLTLRELYTWCHLLGAKDTPGLVALCAEKPAPWIDLLTDDSFAALAEICIRLNFPRAMTLSDKDPVIASAISAVVLGMNEATLLVLSRGKKSPPSSIEPPPSASAPATPTDSGTSIPPASSPSSPPPSASAPSASSTSSSPSPTPPSADATP